MACMLYLATNLPYGHAGKARAEACGGGRAKAGWSGFAQNDKTSSMSSF